MGERRVSGLNSKGTLIAGLSSVSRTARAERRSVIQRITDNSNCKDYDSKSVAAIVRIASEELGYYFVVVLWEKSAF